MNIKNFFYFLIFSVTLAAPSIVLAAVSTELNPLCWQQADCLKVRQEIYGVPAKDAAKGFLPKESPCDKDGWGKCLPAGVTRASIAFGGKQDFSNVGEYIVTIYNYALRIAAILSVIMIIIAGVQYVTSGGNSEMISSAKKRITGAMIGLLIAYLSYFILNSINPALVSLRLPQVYLVRPQVLSTEFCKDMPDTSHFAKITTDVSAAGALQKAFDAVTKFDLAYNSSTPAAERGFDCGQQFFIEKSNTLTCWGDVCPLKDSMPQVCLSQHTAQQTGQKVLYGCVKGQIMLRYQLLSIAEVVKQDISILGLNASDLEKDWLDWKSVTIWGACKKGDDIKVGKWEQWDGGDEIRDLVPGTAYNVIYGGFSTAHDGGEQFWSCPSGYNLVGYYLKTELGVNNNPFKDANLNVGYKDGSSEAVAGTFGDMVKFNNYIPKEKLGQGNFILDVKITGDMIKALVEHKGTAPDSPL